jgi:hypothetical protein
MGLPELTRSSIADIPEHELVQVLLADTMSAFQSDRATGFCRASRPARGGRCNRRRLLEIKMLLCYVVPPISVIPYSLKIGLKAVLKLLGTVVVGRFMLRQGAFIRRFSRLDPDFANSRRPAVRKNQLSFRADYFLLARYPPRSTPDDPFISTAFC